MPANRKGQRNVKFEKKYSVQDLMAKAEEMIQSFHPDTAEKFYIKALEMEPNNTEVMDSLAALLLDMDDWDRAKELLERSMKLDPDGDFSKYMHYGQMSQGAEALKYYQRGIDLMQRERNKMQKKHANQEDIVMLNQQISSAYCTIADLYLTDACFEENAEAECGRALELAIQFDKENPEVYQTMASYRISQQKPEEALTFLSQGYALWKDKDFEEGLPSYEFRHNTAKLFVELNQPRTAAEIWESLLEEDDNIAEVYYHLAIAYRRFNTSAAKENLEKAIILLKRCGDLPFLKEAQQLMEEMKEENIIDEQENNVEDQEEESDDEEEDKHKGENKMEL